MKRENLTAEYREGIKCQICGEKITLHDFFNNNVIKAHGGCKGNVIYGHATCCEQKPYSYEHLVKNKKATYSGFQFGCEFETNSRTNAEQRLQLYSWYKIVCTSDCTVAEEFKSGINQGLHGVKAYLEGIEKIIDIANGDNCGTHANVSLAKWSCEEMDKIRNYNETLFKPLARAMANLTDEQMFNIFGRGFGSYRRYTERFFEHGDWLQIKDECLEFRISRYKNSTQYSHLLMLYKEFCLVIDKIYLVNPNRLTATKCAEKMVKLLRKHAQGKATYQAKERNS